MPLLKSKSKKAFSKNVATEMDAGKPQDQSLAIAYSMKRQAAKKKMASGGQVSNLKENYSESDMCHEGCLVDHAHKYADGGFIKEDDKSFSSLKPNEDAHRGPGLKTLSFSQGRANKSFLREDDHLNFPHESPSEDEHHGAGLAKLAEGGMIDEIMSKRRRMAEGGMADMDYSTKELPGRMPEEHNEELLEDADDGAEQEMLDTDFTHGDDGDMVDKIRARMKKRGA